jgi:RND family efflux transporter MFP subunit
VLELKQFQNFCVGLSVLLLLTTPAAAQSKELSDLAKARDTNGNGVIEKSEAGGPIAANFEIIDADKSGTLDGLEISAFFRGSPSPAPATVGGGSTELSQQAKARDANGNGVIDKSEAGGPIAANFSTIDKDKNGTLDGDEIRTFFQGAARPGGRPTGPPASVVIDMVIQETIGQTTPVIGRLVALEAGPIAARIGGAVDNMRVDVGDRVEAGSILAVLDRERLELERDRYASLVTQQAARLTTARADQKKARNALKRLEGIRKSGAFSQARYDDAVQEVTMQTGGVAVARAQIAQAQNQLQRAERDLTDAEIRAPFPGVVSKTHTEVGAYLSVGTPVVTIINDTNLDIEADVPANRLAGLTPDTVVGVRLDDGSQTTAKLRAIVPSENPRTRTRPVRFIPDISRITKALANNQSVTVLIPVGDSRTAVTVSKDAIIERAGRMTVFLVQNGTAQPTQVMIGESSGDRFIIRSGLKPGDQVVIRGNEQLRPGQRLIILDKGNVSLNNRVRG